MRVPWYQCPTRLLPSWWPDFAVPPRPTPATRRPARSGWPGSPGWLRWSGRLRLPWWLRWPGRCWQTRPTQPPTLVVRAVAGKAAGERRALLVAMTGRAADHVAGSPDWRCRECAQPWPCPELRAMPNPATQDLLPVISALITTAIRDLRGRPGGPDPIDVVRRFLWWLPLSHDEARAIALRMR